MALVIGANSAFIKVTAEDGLTTKIYELIIIRADSIILALENATQTIGATEQVVSIPLNITFKAPYDNTYNITSFKTTISFNNSNFIIDIATLKNNIAVASGGLLSELNDVTVENFVTNGVNSSFDIVYTNSIGIVANSGLFLNFVPKIKTTATAGDTYIYPTDAVITLTKGVKNFILGTTIPQ